ncbi:hypothetical protein Q669_27105 [Labrenzia sp. C1B10]|nr:hypothetical protein Q669_27105 [Labrenzia sp. C1B10]ERS04538.1 hypothetical protein Q675_30440 [Labrenzia sp. C1B70]
MLFSYGKKAADAKCRSLIKWSEPEVLVAEGDVSGSP